MKAIIVVFGNAGHGKDTLAEMIALHLRQKGSTLRLAFADPIKEAALHLLGLSREVAWATAEVKERETVYGKTVRRWLQWLGTEVGREQIHPDVWIHRLADIALDPAQRGTFAVVSDGRFENERTKLAPYVAERAKFLNIPAPKVINILVIRPDVPVKTGHQSESEVYEMGQRALAGERLFHAIVKNEGTLEALANVAKEIADNLAP